jgi:transaldolase
MIKICEMCEGLPVSAESTGKTTDEMVDEGRHLSSLAPNIVVKLPVCAESLAATRTLAAEGVRVNMTLVFSAPQALLAANAGARYVSPFVGRFDDIAEDGIDQLATVVQCIKNYEWHKNVDNQCEIITASVRTPNHVTQAALLGADIATVPFPALKKCLRHPLTEEGLAKFEADWKKVTGKD